MKPNTTMQRLAKLRTKIQGHAQNARHRAEDLLIDCAESVLSTIYGPNGLQFWHMHIAARRAQRPKP